jgi:selenocysteine-specific elongation factor
MYVVATAGHVDHGKSTLVRRLTGMQPDRLAEERERGLTIDLGFAWTELAGRHLAFVDVPGHERFVPNMLAGIGPVPAVLFVVAADEGWMPQSAEHLAALDALGVRHGLLAVTKADRADPAPALAQAREQLAATSLGAVPAVAVSARTGQGIEQLRAQLAVLAERLPPADRAADIRLWIDRAFTVRGAGTVVTGTLAGGTVRAGDEVVLASTGDTLRVRGLQALGSDADTVAAVARVAVNLRGADRTTIRRGDALLSPDAWRNTAEVDVRVRGDAAGDLHRELVLHLGSAAVGVRVRPLGEDSARLVLARELPLRVGDIGLLRDPGQHRVAGAVTVLDPDPPALDRRGAGRRRAAELAGAQVAQLSRIRLARHGFVRRDDLRVLGLPASGHAVGDWLVDESRWAELRRRATELVEQWYRDDPVSAGIPAEALRRDLGLPATALLGPLLAGTGLESRDGVVRRPGSHRLPPRVHKAVLELEQALTQRPFRAPEAGELSRLGLGSRELAAAERAGRLVRIADGVLLLPQSIETAARTLARLPQPFTVSAARQALDTTRRVALPLLERLDAEGLTVRVDNTTRRVREQT